MPTEIVQTLSCLIFECAQKFHRANLFGKVKTIWKVAYWFRNLCFIFYSPYMNCVYWFTYMTCPSFFFFLNDAMN